MKIASQIGHKISKVIKGEWVTYEFKEGKPVDVPDSYAENLIKTYPEKYIASDKAIALEAEELEETEELEEAPADEEDPAVIEPDQFTEAELEALTDSELVVIHEQVLGRKPAYNAKRETLIKNILEAQ